MKLLLNHGRIMKYSYRKKIHRTVLLLGFTAVSFYITFGKGHPGENTSKENMEISIAEGKETAEPENITGFITDSPQCLWGTWRVTQMYWEGTGYEDCEDWDDMKNLEITFLPTEIHFGNTTDITVEEPVYESRLAAVFRGEKGDKVHIPAYPEEYARECGIEGDYVLNIYLKSGDVSPSGVLLPAYFYRLISDDEMIVRNERMKHRAVKIKDAETDGEAGLKAYDLEDVCNGTWEIVEEIGSEKDPLGRNGDVLEVRLRDLRNGRKENAYRTDIISECRVFSLEDGGVRDAAQKFGITDKSSLLVCYKFADTVEWDEMIVRDEMHVILVKGNVYYLAKRISDAESDLIYEEGV